MFVNFNILNQLGSPAINSNTFANRPAAGQTGRLFVSTDTFEIYRDNGTTWDLIGGPGSSTITGTGTATQVAYFTSSQAIGSSANLFWDNANGRLGIRTATPGASLDVHSAADIGVQFNGTGATPTILQQFLSAGVSQYTIGYNWNSDINYRRFSIYDDVGLKEVITIDQQSRYVGINFQYSSLTDQPQYMLDLSGGSFHTNTGKYLVGTPTDLTRSFAASGNANDIAVWLEEYGNVTASADIFFIKGRGTDTAKLNVQVGDSLGGAAFTGYLNAQYNPSMTWGAIVTNLDTTNNHANADFTIAQSYNTTTLTENFRVIANGGNGYLRGSLGIGIQSYSNKLTVLTTSGTDAIKWTDNTRNGYLYIDGAGVGIFSGAIATNQGFYFNNSSDYIDFFTNSAARVRIVTNGNFLIGTTTDTGQKLQVNGTTNSAIEYKVGNYTQGDTTPSVLNISSLSISNSSATTITNFTNGGPYQILVLKFNDSNTTIDRSNAYLSGGVNFVSTANDTLTLIQIGGFWYEVCRSVNA